MLEIRYITETKELTAWQSNPDRFGKADRGREEESIIILDIPLPDKPMEALVFDETTGSLTDNPDYVDTIRPPDSIHISTLVSIDVGRARPAKVKRVWEGRDYFYDCFVTENIKDQYVNGDIIVGDYLLILFEEGDQIVTAKVFKSW